MALMIPILLFITALVFGLLNLAGDPVDIMFAERSGQFITGETKENIRRQLGLDKPLHIQYLTWLKNTFRGDLGYSFFYRQPVLKLINNSIGNTLKIMLLSEFITVSLAIVLGIFAATAEQSRLDIIVSVFSLLGWSMPFFWVGLIFILIFSLYLGWFPSHGSSSLLPGTGNLIEIIIDQLRHLILPVLVMSVGYIAYIFRLVRGNMIEIMDKAYITTARSKGLKEKIVIYKHAFRNAMLPVITVLGLDFGRIFSGVVVLETVFAYPGMGKLLVDSALLRDFPTVLGTIVISTFMVLIGNLGADIAYAYADPRVRY
jgi:peptide/nickel transport system permease protein